MKLAEITSPAVLKSCSIQELEALAQEIRDTILETVPMTGGHLASNLGVVELTLALHRVFDFSQDRLLWDVGHQCYPHKLLTGRYANFSTLRQLDGVCGFPRRDESVYDAFGDGHASTAISAAVGLARARDLLQQRYHVVAVVGDGAMTGGMCYEALNDVGSRKTPLLVILNDNDMSISRNVGALSKQLTRLRVSRGWLEAKHTVAAMLRRVPLYGEKLYRHFQRHKNNIRNILVRDRFFSALGFRYFGPIDGHDLAGMEAILRSIQTMEEPVLLHIVTKKGKGYAPAEQEPEKYHGLPPRSVEPSKPVVSMGKAAGETLLSLCQQNEKVCCVTAAMTSSTGMKPIAQQFPHRLFDVGIAEEHAVTMAAGLACAGMRPFVAIYETFLQRAVDQITMDVCLQHLPVCFLMDRAELGGEDGATHHGVLGIQLLCGLPRLHILAPRCPAELQSMIAWTLTQDDPVAIRYPRDVSADQQAYEKYTGQWEILREGEAAVLLTFGGMIETALQCADVLSAEGIQIRVVNASTIQPLDEDFLLEAAKSGRPIITLEEHLAAGGFGEHVAAFYARHHLPVPLQMLSLPDQFIPHGNRQALLARNGLSPETITATIRKAVHP